MEESHIHSNTPTILNHWLGIVEVKHDLATNMVSNPKRQQLRLPVNQTHATKAEEGDQRMGRFQARGRAPAKVHGWEVLSESRER